MLVAAFFSGVFLCNAAPHLAAGLRGEVFPTPFAKPHGRGPSSPLTNFGWGAFNLLVGLGLLSLDPPRIGFNVDFAALVVGALAIGSFAAVHFGNVRNGTT